MRLDQAVIDRGLCQSRTEAQELIEAGEVSLNGIITTKQTKQVSEADVIVISSRRKFVSRGGEKLAGIMMDVFEDEVAAKRNLSGKYALDIGSSTGGFTDYLLKHGVCHVDAVDVGTNQLHQSLRSDARISVFENTDIRTFSSETKYDVVVTDLSFIPLKHVFVEALALGKSGALYFLLLKPQFEVGKGNTKKGIVKDITLVEEMLSAYEKMARECGLTEVRLFPCRIQGGDGNQEYFLFGVKGE